MYVRSLARDIGVALGTAGHLNELKRIRNGSFSLAEAIPLAAVLEVLERGGDPGLISLRAALAAIPEVEVEPAIERSLRNGDSRALDGLAPRDAELFKVIARGNLIALAAPVSRLTSTIARIFNVE
jgi:tRNA pseudouridine55 synthase